MKGASWHSQHGNREAGVRGKSKRREEGRKEQSRAEHNTAGQRRKTVEGMSRVA